MIRWFARRLRAPVPFDEADDLRRILRMRERGLPVPEPIALVRRAGRGWTRYGRRP